MMQALPSLVIDYIQALSDAGFEGDTDVTYAGRLTAAVDNSIYQQIPQAIVFPKDTNDVLLLTKVANEASFQSLTFTPRGGGTGTNGQSLNTGIVVDFTRYMHRILEINVEEQWVIVETGIVKDALNEQLKQHGLFFAPDLSTSNRAVIGGMINTDASGQGSLVYGKTSDHVLGLICVLISGEWIETSKVSYDEAEDLANQKKQEGELYDQLLQSVLIRSEEIAETFPNLNRFLTGYDLKHAFTNNQVDLGRLICGSEGTLAFVTQAKLNLCKIPEYRELVTIQYDSFDAALSHAPALVEAKATSVETIDSHVLDLAKEDIIWHSVEGLLQAQDDLQGLNIIEFSEHDAAEVEGKVSTLLSILDKSIQGQRYGLLAYKCTNDFESIKQIYAMRKKAVGLLGNTPGHAKPIPFVEDTCVPPEHLAAFIREFRVLLDEKKLHYGMFGHVDSGVLHVRPALDMCDPEQEQLVRKISDQVVTLVAKYGGLMWGEHGKGFRSEYVKAFFGDQLYTELRKIKAAFDPNNRLNPGKICTPWQDDEAELVSVDAVKRGTYDRQIPLVVRNEFSSAMHCNGNGLCFNYDVNDVMCPSWKATGDRRHSPKGRATLMREWLRLKETQQLKKGDEDFSHEVMGAMESCLGCKACANSCPIQVNIPDLKARFLEYYHQHYPRTSGDRVIRALEGITPRLAKTPGLSNAISRFVQKRGLAQKMGLIDLPELSSKATRKEIETYVVNISELEALPIDEQEETVIVLQDAFTGFYESEVLQDFIVLIETLGKQVAVLPYQPNGKPLHVKGFLSEFKDLATKTSSELNRLEKVNSPIVGIDPPLVNSYRDEYISVLGQQQIHFQIQFIQEWLLSLLENIPEQPETDKTFYLFAHCTEKTAKPSTHDDWQKIFNHFGLSLEIISVGCCGMSGNFGHEAKNLELSRKVYQLSWEKRIENLETDLILATGFSCRSQVKRFADKKIRHPIQAILQHLEKVGLSRFG